MGIFSRLSKIEELLEANVPGKFNVFHNALRVSDLPDDWQKAMLQFGYTKNALIFAVDFADTLSKGSQERFLLSCIGWGNGHDTEIDGWKNLLYRDVDRDWIYNWRLEECKTVDKVEEAIDGCYRNLQRYFMFMRIYLKNREQMVKLINIEWDEVIQSTKDD